VILGVAWPDIIIVVILAIGIFRGVTRGFVSELSGVVAVVAALITPWYYNGSFDDAIGTVVRLGPGSAHVVGMFLTGIVTYVIVQAFAWVLNKFASLPGLNIVNGIGGGLIGMMKGSVVIWVALFIALYFPLSPDIRNDLSVAKLPWYYTQQNEMIDNMIESITPWFGKPFVHPYIARHHLGPEITSTGIHFKL
jgi:membrane protein required for colicin V production